MRNAKDHKHKVRRGTHDFHWVRYRGFTLIELLVVMSIISLLMGVLLPAISNARKQAKMVVCASQMRQISMAFQYYAMDWNDWIITAKDPRLAIEGQLAWHFELLPYIGEQRDEDFDKAELWFCPEDKDPFPLGYGSYPHGEGLTSYALNGYYARAKAARPPRPATPKAKLGPAGGFKTSQIRMPSSCMLMVETSYAGQIYDALNPRSAEYGLTVSDRAHHRRTSGFYHNNSMNIMFVDGHVDNTKGRQTAPYLEGITADWLSKNMFWPDLTLPDSTENPTLWGPGYR